MHDIWYFDGLVIVDVTKMGNEMRAVKNESWIIVFGIIILKFEAIL